MLRGKITSLALASIVAASPVFASKHQGTPADVGVINEARILYWLEKRGELSPLADEATRRAAIKNFIANKNFGRAKLNGSFGAKVMDAEQAPHMAISGKKLPSKYQKQRLFSQEKSASAVVNTTVKVLAIMIDFPDLPYNDNRLSASDTDMYYSDYSAEHYNDLLFSQTGYTGPSGQNIQSAYQFYQEESGQSLNFTGNAVGWVTADNDAADYGANGDDGDDIDVQALVLEAVTKAVAEQGIDLAEYDQTDFFDIDGDGNVNEPDGIIDHVMLFHSSVGEEAGGGVLGDDAIWSHRFFVFDENQQPVDVPGSDVRLFGYTINPIDAATGVVVHEFGHDLGLPDEYDTLNGQYGSPVGDWSVMASGSWVGSPAGTSPVSFSPYGRDYFQTRYGGNWINQEIIEFDQISSEAKSLVAATNHESGVNQLKVSLPPQQVPIGAPYTGDYQFYSGNGDEKTNTMSFDVTLPADAATLTMKARWNIEVDYDYLQVMVDGQAIAGNHTKVTNEYYQNVTHFITGDSADIAGAEGDLAWVDLSFDLSSFANQSVTVSFLYKTDQFEGGYGFMADDISIDTASENVARLDAETNAGFTLDGFSRITNTIDGAAHHYYVQLRSANDTDSMLPSVNYHSGVLLWYSDTGVANNQVNAHPGKVQIGVVDADQRPIKSSSGRLYNTSTQISDAAFRILPHTATNFDNETSVFDLFDDSLDYSFPAQPESGIDLPFVGMKMLVETIASDYSSADLTISNNGMQRVEAERQGLTVTLTLEAQDIADATSITWSLGDGTSLMGRTIEHTYASAGSYDVEVSYSSNTGTKTVEKALSVGEALDGEIVANLTGLTLTVDADVTGGVGELTYRWNFGDGEDIVAGQSASHDYEQENNYDVTLTVTDEINQQLVRTLNIDIVDRVAVSITRTVSYLTVNFISSVSGGSADYTYAWAFGDGNTSSQANPSHTYASAGTYNVSVSVTDANGNVAEDTMSVTVTARPAPTTTTSTSSSSGGGSMAWLLIVLGCALARKRG
ncbi:immune inhibitor A [Thalassotalea sp. LPB0316]|uniref:immune inhibitor A domain-containing protein n=1 Tax=Thalassotalea sp. LPB0316 TaxID=2769490 RepID=UPI0018680AC4|nr:immune inhibitor A domain-containing protein [Thalassotalea sp. LPB0316]QOL25335.1 immune inhibitor A [Thalassotalea sp. LPB0316]